jgi:hypothetical protein
MVDERLNRQAWAKPRCNTPAELLDDTPAERFDDTQAERRDDTQTGRPDDVRPERVDRRASRIGSRISAVRTR